MEMHDIYTTQYYNERYASVIEARMKVDENMLRVRDKYSYLEFADKNYSITIAKSYGELAKESRMLNHCVARMDYEYRQINEESLICFLRKINDPCMPYCTIEYDLQLKRVVQCYGKNNCK